MAGPRRGCVAPSLVGSGHQSRAIRETESIRLSGTLLLGKGTRSSASGLVVAGSRTIPLSAEKSPTRSSRFGMVLTLVVDSRMSVNSMSPKRKALLRTTGPPTEKPYWLRLNGGYSASCGTKKFLASMASFRMNSNTDPWN